MFNNFFLTDKFILPYKDKHTHTHTRASTREMCQNIEKGSSRGRKKESRKKVLDIHKFVTNGKAPSLTNMKPFADYLFASDALSDKMYTCTSLVKSENYLIPY